MADEQAQLPDLSDLPAAEYREVREGGKTVADVVKARPEADAVPLPSGDQDPAADTASATETARVRDEAGRFTAGEEPKAGDPRKDPQAKKARIQDEINLLSKQRGETQRERDAIAAERDALKAERDALKAPPESKPEAPKAPTFPSYEHWSAEEGNAELSYDDYIDARADFRYEQRDQKARAERAEHEARTQHDTAWKPFRERQAAFKAAHPDFDQVVARGADVHLPPWMIETLQTAEEGPAVQYYLAQHIEEARAIVGLPVVAAVRKLDAILTSLSAASAVTTDATNQTQADAPFETVGAAPTASSRSLEHVAAGTSNRDFRRVREAQLSGRRR